MTVRNAVAVRDQAAVEVAERPPLHELARRAIERQAVTLAKILPQHMSMERFEQITLAAVKASPKLLRCFETSEGQVSLLYSVLQAAAAGLEVGGLSAEAYLIPYEKAYDKQGNTWLKRWEARLQVSDRGVRDLARRDPRVKELVADVVREGDHFVYRRTLDGDIFEHEVRGPSDRPLTHAYCLIRWKEGGARPIVLDREEVESIRDRYSEGYRADLTKQPDKQTNMWLVRPARAWAKTAIHQARRELDLTPEVEAVLAGATEPDEVPDVVTWPALEVEAEPVAELDRAPANEDGEPIRPQDTENLATNEPWDRPAPVAMGNTVTTTVEYVAPVAQVVTMDDLVVAGRAAGHWDGKTGLGVIRKRIVALAAEHCGATYATPEDLVADQDAVELLLAKLIPAVE
jgi:recombination protein RecT